MQLVDVLSVSGRRAHILVFDLEACMILTVLLSICAQLDLHKLRPPLWRMRAADMCEPKLYVKTL